MVDRRKRPINVLDSDDDETTASSKGSTPAPDTDTSLAPPAAKKSKKDLDIERFNARFKVGAESNETILGASSVFSYRDHYLTQYI